MPAAQAPHNPAVEDTVLGATCRHDTGQGGLTAPHPTSRDPRPGLVAPFPQAHGHPGPENKAMVNPPPSRSSVQPRWVGNQSCFLSQRTFYTILAHAV